MSEAAVAETEVKTDPTPTQETPPPETADTSSPTGAEQKADAGATPAQETPEPTGTDGDGDFSLDFGSIFDAELKAQGAELPAAPTEPQKPGIDLEQYEKQRRETRANDNAKARNNAEAYITSLLKRKYGASDEDAAADWQSAFRPLWNVLIDTNDDYHREVHDWVIDQLPDAPKGAYKSRVYRNTKERLEGLVEAGRQEVEDKWQADLKAGKYLSRDTVEKAKTEAGRKVKGELERLYAANGLVLGKSGNDVNGTSGKGGLDLSTQTKARNAHAQGKIDNARMRAIRDNPSIPEN